MGQVSPTILEEGGAGGVSEDIGLGSQRRGRRFRMILERMAIRSAFQDRGEPTLKCWGTLNWGGEWWQYRRFGRGVSDDLLGMGGESEDINHVHMVRGR